MKIDKVLHIYLEQDNIELDWVESENPIRDYIIKLAEKFDQTSLTSLRTQAKIVFLFILAKHISDMDNDPDELVLDNKVFEVVVNYSSLIIPLVDRFEDFDLLLKDYSKLMKFNKKFSGKKVTANDQEIYEGILSIQAELLEKYGQGHSSGLSKATKLYNSKKKMRWNKEDLKKIAENTRRYRIKLKNNPI